MNTLPKIGVGAGILKHVRDLTTDFGKNILRSPADFITIGSITKEAREGNPEPRYYYDTETGTSWNSVGLRGDGFGAFMHELSALHALCAEGNKELRLSISPVNAGEVSSMIREGLSQLNSECGISLLELNAACPNLWGHGVIARDRDALTNLLEELSVESVQFPIALKIAPDTETEMLKLILDLTYTYGISAIVSGNTRMVDTPRDDKGALRLGMPRCGMAGASIAEGGIRQMERLAELKAKTSSSIKLIACGGIYNGAVLERYIDAGAHETQVVTGVLERGGKFFQELLLDTTM